MRVPRSIWKGAISFGMVSIPVRLFGATQDKDVSFHLLHRTDHGRIKFKRWCSVEDHEVPPEELVRAYEVTKDQYVELTDDELANLPLPSKHTVELAAFRASVKAARRGKGAGGATAAEKKAGAGRHPPPKRSKKGRKVAA